MNTAVVVNPVTGDVKTKKMTAAVVMANVTAGLLGPLLFAPFIAIVDGSIINSVNGDKTPVWQGMKAGYKMLLRHPIKFIRKEYFLCGLCWMVYAGTYAATNNIRSYCETMDYDQTATDLAKFSVSLAVNLGLNQVKDGFLVKSYASKSGVKSALPVKSRILFLCRDSLTMFAAFCIADRVGTYIYNNMGQPMAKKTCLMTANFIVPAALQPVSTYFHLWALENAAAVALVQSNTLASLRPNIHSKYAVSTLSRVARIVPAVSFGNNLNMETRATLLTSWA